MNKEMLWFNIATMMFGDAYLLLMLMIYVTTIIAEIATTPISLPSYLPRRRRNTSISQWLQSWAHRSIKTVWYHIENTITKWRNQLPKKPPWYAKNRSRKIRTRPRQRKVNLQINRKLAIMTIALIGFTSTTEASNDQQDNHTRHIAFASQINMTRPRTSFDSDSFAIAINNCATRSITNNLDDFIKTPRKIKSSTIKGVSGSI